MKSKQSPLTRINRVIKFYLKRGVNKESVNEVNRKIIKKQVMNHILNIKPLSINCAYKGRRFKTDKYDSFIHNCLLMLPKTMHIPDETSIKLAIEFGFSSKASDIDNCCKSFIDCLVKKYKVDDRYIYELHIFKSITKKGEEYIKFKIY